MALSLRIDRRLPLKLGIEGDLVVITLDFFDQTMRDCHLGQARFDAKLLPHQRSFEYKWARGPTLLLTEGIASGVAQGNGTTAQEDEPA